MGAVNNMLTGAQSYQLRKWLDGNRARAERVPAHTLADEAMKELGFRVTVENVNGARRDLGITLRGFCGAGGGHLASARTKLLAAAICALADKLGEKVAPEVRALAE